MSNTPTYVNIDDPYALGRALLKDVVMLCSHQV